MTRIRTAAITFAALTATGAAAAIAEAATVQTLLAEITQSKASTAAKPVPVGLKVTLGTDEDTGAYPPTTSETVVYLPKQLKLNASKFKSCTVAIVVSKTPKGCPAGSKVGTGSANALVGSRTTVEALKVTAFNGPNGKSLVLALDSDASAPAIIHTAFAGKLSKTDEDDYGYKLTFPVPPTLQEPIGGLFTPLVQFITNIRATTTVKQKVNGRKRKVKIRYIELAGCPGGSVPFKTVSTYNTASSPAAAAEPTKTVEAVATCR